MRGESLDTIPVQDAADPRLADYAGLKERDLAARSNAFIAEGELVVRRLAASPYRLRSLLLSDDRVPSVADLVRSLPPHVPVYTAPRTVVHAVVGFPIHRGVLAAGERAPATDPRAMLAACSSLVVLEDIANLDNMGGVFRTAAALGGANPGVLLSPGCCDPLYRKGIRVSMGWALHLPFAVLDPWPHGLREVSAAGFTVIAMTPRQGALSLDQAAARCTGRAAVVLGTEGRGLSEEAIVSADLACRVPMNERVDSLNVVVAGAVALSRLVAAP